jgi:tape measure domain-containing protein
MPINALANLNVKLGFIFDTKSLAAVEKSLQRTGDRLAKTGQNISLFISAPLALIGGNAIKAAGEFESLSLAMQATFKNAGRTIGEANAEVEALRKAALAPGLDFPQAVAASIRLQSVGLSAEKARDTIQELANAVASTGGTAQQLESVTVQMAQMISKGKVLSGDLRIIQENLPIISDLMLKAFGTSNAEKIQELGITGKEFVSKITVEMAKLSRVSGGISNALVNAGSAVKQALAGIGEEIARVFNITDLSDRFAAALHSIVEGFKGLGDGTKKAIVIFAAFLAALGPIALIMGGVNSVASVLVGTWGTMVKTVTTVTRAFAALNLVTQQFILIGIVTAILGIAAAMGAFNTELSTAEKTQRTLNKIQEDAKASIQGEKVAVDGLISILNSETASREAKVTALEELKKRSPEYFGQLREEKGEIVGLVGAYEKYIAKLILAAQTKANEEELIKLGTQRASLLKEQARLSDQLAKAAERESAARSAPANLSGGAIQLFDAGNANEALNANEAAIKSIDVQTSALFENAEALANQTAKIVDNTKKTVENANAGKDATKTKAELAAAAKLHTKEINDTAKAEQELIDKQELDLKMLREIEQAWKDEAAAAKAGIEAIKKANPNFDQIGPRGQTPQAQPSRITDVQQGLFDSAPITLAAQNIAFLREKMDELKASASQVGQAFNIAADGISSIAGIIGSALESTSGSWADFAKSALTAIADVIGALIRLAVTQAFAASLKASSFLGPLAIPIAAAAGALAASLLKGLINRSSFAKGTNDAPGGLSLVGEKGPELVNLPRHSQVFPAHRTSAMLGDMGGGVVVLQPSIEYSADGFRIMLNRAENRHNRRNGG